MTAPGDVSPEGQLPSWPLFFHAAGVSYHWRERFTTRTTNSMTGTSMSTPTTVARAAPELKPKMLMAAATASSKKLLAPISAEGQATLCFSPTLRFSQ